MKTPANFWSYKAPAPAPLSAVPASAFKGTSAEWESLSPGMRREIVRTFEKLNSK